jgi:hypothetical protein
MEFGAMSRRRLPAALLRFYPPSGTSDRWKALPKDEQNPMADGAIPDHLILWLAYKEAKAMIGFADPPTAPAQPAGK